MAEVGNSTGKKTQAGREVYETPDGEMVSEKSTTFEYKGKWINVPTIHNGYAYDDDMLRMMLDAEVIEPTSTHKTKKGAINSAIERSESLKFNEGGAVMDEQMEMAFTEAERVDPVSGNDVPPGSLPEEVRDDIPAMLSEGEYVVPADVLRFYGMKFFEDLRNEAKMGLSRMEQDGRIGGEPVAGPEMGGGQELSPEEQAELDSMMMAVGGFVQQPTETSQTDPYMQQQAMYNTGAPKAVGNAGYADGGMMNRDWANFNPWAETSQQTEQSVRVVTLYGPSGQVATVTLPAQQAQYDELLASGYRETPVAVTTETSVSKDTGGGGGDGGGGTFAQAKAGKPYREMTPDELKKAYEDNQKARSIMRGMSMINPVIGLVGMGATKFAESQIVEAMKEKKVDLPEEKDFFDTILTPFKSFFGLDKSDATTQAPTAAAKVQAQKGDDRTSTLSSTGRSDRSSEISVGQSNVSKGMSGKSTDYKTAAAETATKSLSSEEKKGGASLDESFGITGLNKGGLMQNKKKKKKK